MGKYSYYLILGEGRDKGQTVSLQQSLLIPEQWAAGMNHRYLLSQMRNSHVPSEKDLDAFSSTHAAKCHSNKPSCNVDIMGQALRLPLYKGTSLNPPVSKVGFARVRIDGENHTIPSYLPNICASAGNPSSSVWSLAHVETRPDLQPDVQGKTSVCHVICPLPDKKLVSDADHPSCSQQHSFTFRTKIAAPLLVPCSVQLTPPAATISGSWWHICHETTTRLQQSHKSTITEQGACLVTLTQSKQPV